MAVTRYRPVSDLFRPFDDFLGPFMRMGSTMRTPDTDVLETAHEIRVVTELPDMEPEDIDISLENNILTISGEKTMERTEGDENATYHLSERRWGKFSRSFVLPREVEQDRIDAQFRNGVLTITIPKSEKAKPRRISIRNGGETQRVEAGQQQNRSQ